MEAMYNLIKNHKRVKRANVRRKLRMSIITYNRIKSHFEEEHKDCKYDKTEREWLYLD